jgi:small subunit ribosomal protein S20
MRLTSVAPLTTDAAAATARVGGFGSKGLDIERGFPYKKRCVTRARRSCMPTIASAAKRLRQTRRRTLRNRAARSRLRASIKKARQAAAAGDRETAAAAFRAAVAVIDKTASKGIIHPRTAGRYKSRLALHLQSRGSAS